MARPSKVWPEPPAQAKEHPDLAVFDFPCRTAELPCHPSGLLTFFQTSRLIRQQHGFGGAQVATTQAGLPSADGGEPDRFLKGGQLRLRMGRHVGLTSWRLRFEIREEAIIASNYNYGRTWRRYKRRWKIERLFAAANLTQAGHSIGTRCGQFPGLSRTCCLQHARQEAFMR